MTVDECIAAFENMGPRIFNAGSVRQVINGANTGARFSADALEQVMKDVVAQRTGNPDALMRDPVVDGCQVCVLPLSTLF